MKKEQIQKMITDENGLCLHTKQLASYLATLEERLEKMEGKKCDHRFTSHTVSYRGDIRTDKCNACGADCTPTLTDEVKFNITKGKDSFIGAGGGKLVEEECPMKGRMCQCGYERCIHYKSDFDRFLEQKWYITGRGQVVQLPESEKTKGRKAFLGEYSSKEQAEIIAYQIKQSYGDK